MNINDIVLGKIDINNQELFFSTLIKGLLLNLNNDIMIRGAIVPHIITHTGSDALYLENKGYNFAIEPSQISNENYIYNIIPRCVVNPSNIDMLSDQLTHPYTQGRLQYEDDEQVYELVAEFRRVPLKMTFSLQYITDSFRDMMELIQQLITKLSFIRTYNITYMGQSIKCSYKLPESFSEEHLMDIEGNTTDTKTKKLSIDIEVETNFPVYNQRTVIMANGFISELQLGGKRLGPRYQDSDYPSTKDPVTEALNPTGIKTSM
jgi:hypothetical protein